MSGDDKSAIVTGASAGIGKAICDRMVRSGYHVLAIARGRDGLARMKSDIGAGSALETFAVDICQIDAAERAAALALERFGRLDCLVNNAGSSHFAPLLRSSLDEIDQAIELSLKAPIRFVRAALPAMKDGGAIVNVGSTFGLVGGLNGGVYCAVKAALVGLTQSIAADYGARGIRCNLVAPGVVRTAMTDAYWDSVPFRRVNQEMIPARRDATAVDIANAVNFLASSEAGFINGQTLAVDGGWSTTKYLDREAILAERK